MDLRMESALARGYRSRSQIARVVTEAWAARCLYCAACNSDSLRALPANTQASDYECPACRASFQLKSSSRWSERSIPDAGYDAMIRAVMSESVPNLLVLHYTNDWRVRNLLIVPSVFVTPSAIERRKPLGPGARRAGWVGCNIRLDAIATAGKVRVVVDGVASAPASVRAQYSRAKTFARLDVEQRGWSLDVLQVVQSFGRRSFSLADVYAFEARFKALHPRNANIRPKIRQQLQVLRDLGVLTFTGRGMYELNPCPPH